MKKILVLILAAVLLLSLAACGGAAPSEPADPSKVAIGKWELKMTMPDGVKSEQYLEFNEDGTGAYTLIEDGEQTSAYDFEWTYENELFVCVNKNYADYYFYTAEANTLTDDHSHGRVFKPAN